MNPEELESALKDAPETARRGWRCPANEVVSAYTDGALDANGRAVFENHLAGCGFCLGQVAALAKLSAEPPPEVSNSLLTRAMEIVPGMPARRSPRWQWGLAAAATAGIVIMIAPLMRNGHVMRDSHAPAPPVPEPRDIRRAPSYASARPEIEFPREDAAVNAADLEVRWTPLEGTLFYEVTVVTPEGDIVWQAQADAPHLRLPPAAPLMAGHMYYVSVRAYLAQDKTVQSTPVRFDLSAGR